MSKFIYIYQKEHLDLDKVRLRLKNIITGLIPDNIVGEPSFTVGVIDNAAYAITMPKQTFHVYQQESVLLGKLFEDQPDYQWHVPFKNYPDGNYAIIRSSQDYLEIVSDATASRTIWYYLDEDLFIASTSQRAIIMYLGSFEFDKRVIPWMLSTGTLGPEFSWDKRLKRLQADSSVVLDKKKWAFTVQQNEAEFCVKIRTEEEHKRILTDNIRKTVQSLSSVDFNKWVLPLSGGYDSRAILCFLLEQPDQDRDLRTVTWGLEDSVNDKENDATIALELAKMLGVKHYYYHTDISPEPIETIIDRFVKCSEGRIDHIAAYMDGMEIWRTFYNEGIDGVIRGDEGFGWSEVSSETTVRLSVGCQLCSDYLNLTEVCEKFGIPGQMLPESFAKKGYETLEQWRDRLYHVYRLPTILAALSDIKFSYVEQINPLLSKKILQTVRTLPDKYRTNKSMFRDIVNTIGPDIPYATKSANALAGNILKKAEMVNLIRRELNDEPALHIFDPGFITLILQGIRSDYNTGKPKTGFNFKSFLDSFVPRPVKNWIRDKGIRTNLDGNIFAFRVFMIIRMHKIIEEDLGLVKK